MLHVAWNVMGMERKMMIRRDNPYSNKLGGMFKETSLKLDTLASGYILPDENRCVQCGICSFNCPINVDVRSHALRGLAIQESKCLTCGECVRRCPRGVLRFVYPD